jgi:hypothetical protein
MPLFFFDVQDGGTTYTDEFGVELDTVDEAAGQALALLPDLARDRVPDGPPHDFAVTVRDAGGAVVHRASLLLRGGWVGGAVPADRAG